MQYSHLNFFNNGSAKGETPISSTLPPPPVFAEGDDANRSFIRIVEYIKSVPVETKVSTIDINKALGIDISQNRHIIELLKGNPKLESGIDNDGAMFFRYRAKLIVHNKSELKHALARTDVGVLMSDVEGCYVGVRSDIMDMIRGGEIIGVENKALKTLVLFSRGSQFLSRMSGTVNATTGSQIVETSDDLTGEIRRGEAVLVGNFWYRVSSAVKVGAGQDQPQRARAPASVTFDKELSDRNEYVLPFTSDSIPLDGDFEDNNNFSGSIIKHGATNDVRSLWRETAKDIEQFLTKEEQIIDELYKQKHILYDRNGLLNARTGVRNLQKSRKGRGGGAGRTSSKFMVGSGSNPHLLGSGIEKIMREVEQEQIARLRK